MLTIKCPECSEFYEFSCLQCPNCASRERTGKDLSGHQPPLKESEEISLRQRDIETESPTSRKIGYAILSILIIGLALFVLLSQYGPKLPPQITQIVPPPRALVVAPLFRANKVNNDAKIIIHNEHNVPNKVAVKKETPEQVTARPNGVLHSEFNVPNKREIEEKPVSQPIGLVQLCHDWLFYRKMIAQAKEEGSASKLTEYQDALEIVNSWLSDYKEDEIQAVMVKIDKDSVFARSEEKQEKVIGDGFTLY